MTTQYEFSESEEKVFATLRTRLLGFAIAYGVFSLAALTVAILMANTSGNYTWVSWFTIGSVVLDALLVYLFVRTQDNINNIVNTSGNDINELLTAMSEMSLAYSFFRFVLLLNVLRLAANLIPGII